MNNNTSSREYYLSELNRLEADHNNGVVDDRQFEYYKGQIQQSINTLDADALAPKNAEEKQSWWATRVAGKHNGKSVDEIKAEAAEKEAQEDAERQAKAQQKQVQQEAAARSKAEADRLKAEKKGVEQLAKAEADRLKAEQKVADSIAKAEHKATEKAQKEADKAAKTAQKQAGVAETQRQAQLREAEERQRVQNAIDSGTRVYQFTSHIEGRNALVNIYADRIEWASQQKFVALTKRGMGTNVILMQYITGVTTKRGLVFTELSVIAPGQALVGNVEHGQAEKIKQFILAMKAQANQPQHIVQQQPREQASLSDELMKLAQMKQSGIITEADFNAAKARLLGSGS